MDGVVLLEMNDFWLNYTAWLGSKSGCEERLANILMSTTMELPDLTPNGTDCILTNYSEENTISRALSLRTDYAWEHNLELPDQLNEYIPQCTFFELIYSVAVTIELDFLSNPDYGDRTQFWFNVILKNLGLNDTSTDNIPEIQEKVNKASETVNNRTYDAQGRGGMLTLPKYKKDLRRECIWNQICAFATQFI